MNIGVTIASIVFLICVIATFLFPGYMMQSRIAKVVGGRDLEGFEHVLAVIPGFNLAITRNILYNSFALPVITNAVCVLVVVVNFFVQTFITAAIPTIIFFVLVWIALIVTWIINGYIIQDAANCMGLGLFWRVLAFIAPPLTEFVVARYTAGVEEEE